MQGVVISPFLLTVGQYHYISRADKQSFTHIVMSAIVAAVHEETHHVKKKTIRDVTDICVLHDGTLLLALTLKDNTYV